MSGREAIDNFGRTTLAPSSRQDFFGVATAVLSCTRVGDGEAINVIRSFRDATDLARHIPWELGWLPPSQYVAIAHASRSGIQDC